MKKIEGGVTAAKGFFAAGLEVGIKAGHTGKKDMAMVYSDVPCKVAGTFTSNVVKAAPVKYDQNVVDNSPFVQAVVVNSGVAKSRRTAEYSTGIRINRFYRCNRCTASDG